MGSHANRADAARSPVPNGERIDALDASRGFLMLLGLVIHAAAPYRDLGGWLVDEPGGSALLTHLSVWISTFRMPAFFLLAGLLSAWALQRRAGAPFLARRAGRLLLPLAVCAVTLNLLQRAWVDAEVAQRCAVGAACVVNQATAPWLGHLWFLLDLFVYTVILVGAAPLFRRVALVLQSAIGMLPRWLAATTLVVLPFVALFAWSLAVGTATFAFDALDRPWLGFWSFTWVADHLFFFVVGAVLAAIPATRALLASPFPLSIPVLSGVLGTLALVARAAIDMPRNSPVEKIAWEFLDAVPTVLLTVFAITACLRLQRHARGLAGLVARWSYSVYLFHHLVAVAVALWLLDVALPLAVKFAITLATVALVPVLAAVVVERSRILTLLFNGEWRVPTRDRVATAGSTPAAAPAPQAAPGSGAWVLEILEAPVRVPAAARESAEQASRDRLAG